MSFLCIVCKIAGAAAGIVLHILLHHKMTKRCCSDSDSDCSTEMAEKYEGAAFG